MHDPASELRRIPLPRTSVDKAPLSSRIHREFIGACHISGKAKLERREMDDPILYWNDVALEANRVSHTNGKGEQTGPALSSRALAIVHLAMYDAFVGPSVSRDRLQSELRICQECLENRVRDASLETAHRLPARFALRQLLTEVGSAAGIAASLADRDHVQHLVEAAVPGQREPVPDHLPAGGLDGSQARVGGEVRPTRKPSHVAHDADDLRGQDRSHAEDLGEGG